MVIITSAGVVLLSGDKGSLEQLFITADALPGVPSPLVGGKRLDEQEIVTVYADYDPDIPDRGYYAFARDVGGHGYRGPCRWRKGPVWWHRSRLLVQPRLGRWLHGGQK